MYGNVIIAVGGGPGGCDAARLAATLAGPEAFMTLVFVSTPHSGLPMISGLERAGEGALPELLEEEVHLCGGEADVQRVSAASVGAGIEHAAQELGADLVVVGLSRRHGLERLLSRDSSLAVLHRSVCSVAVAPSDSRPRLAVHRVGVAYDGSPESDVALAHAGQVAAEHGAELILRHVVAPDHIVPRQDAAARLDDDSASRLAARRRLGRPDGLEVEQVHGLLGPELTAFSADVDLLACGSRHHGLIGRLAVGSTSQHLACQTRAPLLVTPATDPTAVARWRHRDRTAVP